MKTKKKTSRREEEEQRAREEVDRFARSLARDSTFGWRAERRRVGESQEIKRAREEEEGVLERERERERGREGV